MDLIKSRHKWGELLDKYSLTHPLPVPPPKIFKPKMNLPKLATYRNMNPGSKYWSSWPYNGNKVGRSRIDGHKLKSMALEAGYKDKATLDKVFIDLTEGARIGCEGTFRQPSFSTNAESALGNGEKVSDAIAEWIHEGYAHGPVNKSCVPKEAKISGIMTKTKPNGSVRVILNLSAPIGKSVNEGIDNAKFPATMSSTTRWLRVLAKAGVNSNMVKIDWSAAYKQIAVHCEDVNLQWFQWLDKYFCELSLIFGSVSSVGIFDRTAKVVLSIVIFRSKFPPSLTSQHLDDCCAAAPANDTSIYRFDNEYKSVAEELGITLASRDDPEKSFAPTKEGCVYGIYYNTVTQTWWVSEERIARIQHQIKELLDVTELEQQKVWSLAGRIIHLKDLIIGGRFHVGHLLKANSVYTDKEHSNEMVEINGWLKREMWWWFTMLVMCARRTQYPDPDRILPCWSLIGYTDAAGGTSLTIGSGCGAVLQDWWIYIPWSEFINRGGMTSSGRQVARKLSALELVAPLALLCGAPDKVRGKPLKIMVDNIGSVCIWRKGYSTSCELSSTLVRAIFQVSTALDCDIDIVKVTRCSDTGSEMADALSKAEFLRFRQIANDGNHHVSDHMGNVSQSLLSWINQPQDDWYLGDRILRDMSKYTPILGYNC